MNLKRTARELMRKPTVEFLVAVGQRFGRDHVGLFAAGLAFFLLLSIGPLVLTAVAVCAFFIHDPAQAASQVRALAMGLVPSGGAQTAVKSFLTSGINMNAHMSTLVRGRALAGVLGAAFLLWSSMQIFVNASGAMNGAFEVKEKRSWLGLRAVALGLLVVSGILMFASLALSAAPTAIAGFDKHYVPFLPVPLWLLTVICETLAVTLNALLFLIVFRYLPATNVSWRAAAIGGITASIFWEVAKKGLAVWLLRPNHSIYGDLANIILFIAWIYYSMMILLLGAEVTAVLHKSGSWARREAHFGQTTPDVDEHGHTHPARRERPQSGRRKNMGAETS